MKTTLCRQHVSGPLNAPRYSNGPDVSSAPLGWQNLPEKVPMFTPGIGRSPYLKLISYTERSWKIC